MSDESQSEQRVIREAIDSANADARTERFDHWWYLVWLIVVAVVAGFNAHDAASGGRWSVLHGVLAVLLAFAFVAIVVAELRGYLRRRRNSSPPPA